MRAVPPRPAHDPAADAGHFLFRLGLAILMTALPIGAALSRRLMFVLLPVGALMAIAGAMLAAERRIGPQARRMAFGAAGLAALALVFWAALSHAWTPFPVQAGGRAFKLAATAALCAFVIAAMPRRMRSSNLYLLPIGVALACVASVAFALLRPEPASAELEGDLRERAGLFLAVLVWPAAAALAMRARWGLAAALTACVVGAVTLSQSAAGLGALAAGALAFSLVLARAQVAARWIGVAFALVAAVGPALAILSVKLAVGPLAASPFAQMLALWADLAMEQGLRVFTGHGFDAVARGVVTGYLAPGGPRGLVFSLWFELGIVGAWLAAFLILRAFTTAGVWPRPLGAFLAGGLAAILIVSMGSPAAYQLWHATIVGVAAIGFAAAARLPQRVTRPALADALVTGEPRRL
jgi:hypothetical protein